MTKSILDQVQVQWHLTWLWLVQCYLALTLGGTAAFVASLPFTALGGNVEEAAKTLVIGPAKSTFTRCMGCTATQDALKTEMLPTINQYCALKSTRCVVLANKMAFL
jgi:hypothetical protein